MIKNEKNYVVLVKVTPDGRAEEALMSSIKKIHEKFPSERHSVRLYELFGLKTLIGEPYNLYVFSIGDLEELNEMQHYISELMYNTSIEFTFPEDEMLPEVTFGIPRE